MNYTGLLAPTLPRSWILRRNARLWRERGIKGPRQAIRTYLQIEERFLETGHDCGLYARNVVMSRRWFEWRFAKSGVLGICWLE